MGASSSRRSGAWGRRVINEELRVNLGQITAELERLKQSSREADQRAQAASARVARTEAALRKVQVEASQVTAAIERASKTFGKKLARAGVAYGAGLVLSEIGTPEALQPLLRVGTSAYAGFQTAGVAGLATFATVQSVLELVGYVRKAQADLAQAAATIEALREDQARIKGILEERERAMEERFKDFVAKVQLELEKEMRELDYQTFQLSRF
jgi:peptidoglycan hydrolase CwlO-like protein